jgi:hypothetical protein
MSSGVLSAWLLSIMLAAVPPGRAQRTPDAKETAEQGKARYAAIANAMARVALDPKEKPLFLGPDARAKTALLMLAISLHESHWRRDVDLGLGRQAKRRYHCMMQIAVAKTKTPEGWTARDLVRSRKRCFRRGLHILQRGQKHCREHGPRAFLNHYASGYCDHGRKAVAKRWRTFDTLRRMHPLPRRSTRAPKRK